MRNEYKSEITTPITDYDKMLNDIRFGKEKGTTTYIDKFDQCWTWKKGTVNIISGYNNEGKGLWFRQLALIKALEEGKKFVFYAPEDHPSSELFDDMIHTLTGKSTDKDNSNFITEEEFNHAYNLIKDLFYFVYIKPPKNTLSNIMEQFQILLDSDPEIYGFLIDPHIKVARDKDTPTRDDLYGAEFMSITGDFARVNEKQVFIVMHQQTPVKKEDGNYPEPDSYSVKQGGTYSDTADGLMVVWRPNFGRDKIDPKVIVGTKKLKQQKLVGLPQSMEFMFDRRSNRYTDEYNNPLYNFNKWMKSKEERKPKLIL